MYDSNNFFHRYPNVPEEFIASIIKLAAEAKTYGINLAEYEAIWNRFYRNELYAVIGIVNDQMQYSPSLSARYNMYVTEEELDNECPPVRPYAPADIGTWIYKDLVINILLAKRLLFDRAHLDLNPLSVVKSILKSFGTEIRDLSNTHLN